MMTLALKRSTWLIAIITLFSRGRLQCFKIYAVSQFDQFEAV